MRLTPTQAFWSAAGLLAAFNVLRSLGVFGSLGSAANALIVVISLGVVALSDLDRGVLGLGRGTALRGLWWGLGATAVVVVVVVLAAAIPATSGFLDDARADITGRALALELFVGIYLLTAIPEELAFRGLLLGAGTEAWGTRTAVLASSALFGLWHIAPTLSTMSQNAQVATVTGSSGGRIGVVVGSVAVTFVAGLLFSWLRLRSDSLVAPTVAHLATNGVALTVAWFVVR